MLARLKQGAKHLYFALLLHSGVTRWARRRLEQHGASLVLTFHRVLDDEALGKTSSPAGMIVRQKTFVSLLNALAQEGDFVSLGDLPRRSPRLLTAITFDDGWADNFRVCLDLLQPREIPACIFICSEKVGLVRPFWPERALSSFRAARTTGSLPSELLARFSKHDLDLLRTTEHNLLEFLKNHPEERPLLLAALEQASPPANGSTVDATMTWAELRTLRESGVELGSHTAHHEILTELAPPDQAVELQTCNERMKQELGTAPTFFCYPNGSWDERGKQTVASNGYRRAFINTPGVWSEATDPHLIPRVNLSENRLIGLDGSFSLASAHYCIFWLPYLHRARSRRRSGASQRSSGTPLTTQIAPDRPVPCRREK